MTTETTTDMITAEEAKKLAHKYRFANNDLERVLCETARTVIALHAQLADAQAAQAMVVERCADMIEDNVRHAKELGREIWAMPDLRALAPIDGLALVRELRAESETRHQLRLEQVRITNEWIAERDRLAAANAALEARLANGMKWCDLMDGPVSKSQFVNGQATAAQQIRAALAEVQADARREGGE